MNQVYSAWKHMFSEYPAILDLIHTVSIVQEIGILLLNSKRSITCISHIGCRLSQKIGMDVYGLDYA